MPPLNMAMRQCDYQSAKALLEAGYPLIPNDLCLAESLKDDNKMTTLLISELSMRRKRLGNFAQASMSREDLADIGLTDASSVPDIIASKISLALKARGIKIDPSIDISEPTSSVYHQSFLKTETLDLLFAHDFKDIDSRDHLGRTPLMVMVSSSGIFETSNGRRQWLISKGADPTQSLPWGGGTVLHFLGTSFASMLAFEITHTALTVLQPFQAPEPDSAEKDPLFDLRYVLRAPHRDGCVCACSIDGCTPLLAALRHLLQYTPRFFLKDGANRLPRSLNFLISRSDHSIQTSIAIIRLLTFDALDLKHTCCRKSNNLMDDKIAYMDKAEVEEIRDEESLLLAEFEDLLNDLVAEFERLCFPIMEFLQGPWNQRVIEHINRLDSYDELHVREVQEIGLNLQVAENVSERVSLMLGSTPQVVGIEN